MQCPVAAAYDITRSSVATAIVGIVMIWIEIRVAIGSCYEFRASFAVGIRVKSA